ncbi:cytidine deaminase [Xenorhabdus cabanillasii]|uniref:Cytidine deaminase n=1 Tax=Xenorhabdus cabanillasii JM26 TaxID=1427517 RepID=W1J7M1_9GAMM|nr:cytidine deaminase [Xenorhabdus cabanillasii]PHM78551.1 cytidine deaminase [Xenorhabdus cabanillasii JM26]CDL85861.1 Cytidine deaminase [Xenorhabdus cabanillasii JM26]
MQARFHAIWSEVTPKLQKALLPYIGNDDFPAMLTAEQVESIKQSCGFDDHALALALLPLAAACSIAPISHFHVGAIAQGESGNFYFGANMEFVGVPLQQTVHAEQSAITHAWLRGEKKLLSVTVSCSPCGHCRQFMNELNSGIQLEICLPDRPRLTLADYLPEAFGPRDLGDTPLLLDSIHHGYQLDTNDELVLAALDAANQSHSPYSQSHSGIALMDEQNRVYTGRYAENAAFNPSLPPLQAALILMNMSGSDCRTIKRAILVEGQNNHLSQWNATESTLISLGCKQTECHTF